MYATTIKKRFLKVFLYLAISFSMLFAFCLPAKQVFAYSQEEKEAIRKQDKLICQERIKVLVSKILAARQPNGEKLTVEQQLKWVHDWLIVSTEYDYKLGQQWGFSSDDEYIYGYDDIGPIVYGRAVCEGYMEAFSSIMDELNRQTGQKIVDWIVRDSPDDHAWNQVQLDGKWYNIDVTWDDTDDTRRRKKTYSAGITPLTCNFLVSDSAHGLDSTRGNGKPATSKKYENVEWPYYQKDFDEYEVDFVNPGEVYASTDGSFIPSVVVRYGLNVLPEMYYKVERIDKPKSGATPELGTAKIRITPTEKCVMIKGSITKTVPIEISGTAKSSTAYTLGGAEESRPFDKEFKPFANTYTYSELSTLDGIKSNKSLTLKQGTDYTVAYADNQKAGWATATITLKGKYSGKITVKYQVTGKTGGKITGTAKSTEKYGLGKSSSVRPFDKTFQPLTTTYKYNKLSKSKWLTDKTLTLKKGVDYTVSYKNNKKVGWATATITLKGKYSGKVTVQYQIQKSKISGTAKSTKRYKLKSGKSKKAIRPFDKTFQPFATNYTYSKLSKSKWLTDQALTLKKGTDYTVSYKNNKKAGWATATITLKGKYSGKVTVKYKITK